MRISDVIVDKLIQIFAFFILTGITIVLISIISSGDFPYVTNTDDYRNVYAYTDEPAEEMDE